MKARKSLGQHFLKSKLLAEKIVETARVSKKDTVLEIGPGTGILTKALLAHAGHVVAVEKDTRMVEYLKQEFADEIVGKKLMLLYGDALSSTVLKRAALKKYKLVANIPYYITGQLFRIFLSATHQPNTMVLLVQKEVAHRIARDKKGSLLSMSIRAYAVVHYVQRVKAGNFSPRPRVDSAILALENISRKRFKNIKEEKRFFELIHTGFSHKRKFLMGNLKQIASQTRLEAAFEHAGVPEKARAEDLTINTWIDLLRTLSKGQK